MLSGILNSEKAINVNIFIIRTFVLMRQYALDYTGLEEKDESEKQKENFKNRPRIGFKQRDKD